MKLILEARKSSVKEKKIAKKMAKKIERKRKSKQKKPIALKTKSQG